MKQAMKQITRPRSLFETAAQYIRQAITKGHLKLGQPISEGALASSLGISKTPVREALAFAFDRNRMPFLAAEKIAVDGMRSAKKANDEERYLELDSGFHIHLYGYPFSPS